MKRRSDSRPAPKNLLSGEQRLNKLLAAAGLGSRRQVDELIEQGRVEVDGVVADHLGTKVDTEKNKVSVDGVLLKKFRPVYFALHKPAGILCTNRDPKGRPRAIDLIPGHHRLFSVGRLDASSVGLLLMTNDGELTQRLTHPKHGVPKTYFVVVAGHIDNAALKRLQRGIYLAEGLAKVEGAKVRRERKGATELEITLCEGKNREIRRVLARLGNKVVTLRRLSIGPLKLADMPEGAYRPLTQEEVASLYRAADEAAKARRKKKDKDEATDSETPGKGTPKTASTDRLEKATKTKRAAKPAKASVRVEAKPTSTPSTIQSERDPFAWDDDDALLAASPFGDQTDLHSQEDDEDFDESDFDNSGFDTDDEDASETDTSGMVLVREGGRSPRGGKVIDYGDDETPSRPAKSGFPKKSARKFDKGSRGFKKSTFRSGERSGGDRDERPNRKGFKKRGTKKFGGKKFGGKKSAPTSRGLKGSRKGGLSAGRAGKPTGKRSAGPRSSTSPRGGKPKRGKR